MVTKKEVLKKLKLSQLKDAAKEVGVDSTGKKTDLVELVAEKIKKEELHDLISKLTIPKPTFGVFDHVLVPKEEILAGDEIKKVFEKYHCTKDNLPKILFSDPSIKLLGARPGDVIRITRNSQTAGKSAYYRVVVR